MIDRNSISKRRRGFTLIEMLVAISILTVLATLAVAVIPKIQERTKASAGGDKIQGWLLIAKQWALRDRAPRGVRLIVDPTDNYIRTLQYIERPDPITGGFVTFDQTTPNPNRVFVNNFDLSGGLGAAASGLWPVQPGDFLQIQGGAAHIIASVDITTTPNSLVTLYPVWSAQSGGPPGPTPTYTIIRQPRPIAGEDYLQLPADVAIDPFKSGAGSTSTTLASLGAPYYDIVFTPSGTLTGTLGDSFGRIILWVRDITQDPDQPGDQPLIVVFCRTGRIGGFPYNPDPALTRDPTDPNAYLYYYATDPRATGL